MGDPMTTTGKSKSYSQFQTWMAEFQLGDNNESIRRRWNAAVKLADEIDFEDIEALVRLALKTRQRPSAASVDSIVTHLQEEGDSFSASQNARELEVLSAIVLVYIASDPENSLASEAALTVLTSLVAGTRKPNLPFDLHGLITAAIDASSRGVGRRPAPPTVKATPRVSFETGAIAIAGNDWGGASNALTASGTATDSAIQQLSNQLSNVTKTMTLILQQQDEELQMLWWLLGGRSEDLDIAFDALSGDKQALTLAKELAAHTTLLPGPSSVPSLLAKAGLKARGKVGVATAVNACDPDWLRPLVDGLQISPVVHPIHFGIERQIEVGSGTDWVANWAAVTGLKADIAFAPLTLGELFYRERLLLQAS